MERKFSKEIAYLGLGSNMGDPLENAKRAIQLLKNNPHLRNTRSSSFYKTSPVGYKEQDWFINAVVECETDLSPQELLKVCQGIENQLGRVRTVKWGPRAIDIDILFYGEEIVNTQDLIIPHPQLNSRKFVLVPLCELNPHLHHPLLDKTVSEILEDLANEDIVLLYQYNNTKKI